MKFLPIKCPHCMWKFDPEGLGECPSCANPFEVNFSRDIIFISWGYADDVENKEKKDDEPQRFEIVADSHYEKCPNCSKEYKKIMIQSKRYFIVRKKCSCGTEDEEIIRR